LLIVLGLPSLAFMTTANALVTSHDLIAYEDLKIRNIVKNRYLAKSIDDAGWGTFLQWVKAYGAIHNVPIIAVAPHFTSQNCSAPHLYDRHTKQIYSQSHIFFAAERMFS